jgi:molecular chaperone DnaJ
MDINKNYYAILGVPNTSTEKEIKKRYYKLSFDSHPDRNKDIDPAIFTELTEAYNVLCGEERFEYDLKSKFGNNYNEYFELFDINVDFTYDESKEKLDTFKKNEINNIYIDIDDTFDGTIEYERWSKCKTCDGTGKDLSSRILIKDVNGNVIKSFEAEDGCDVCEGTGKYMNQKCSFCHGKGRVGLNLCKTCNGKGGVIGKQKLKGVKLTGEETKIDAMGHWSKNGIGYILLIKKK